MADPDPKAAAKTYRSKSGGHVRIWWAPYLPPIDVPAAPGTISFEANTEQRRVLHESPEVEEVKATQLPAEEEEEPE